MTQYSGTIDENKIVAFTKRDDASEGAPDLTFYEQGEGAWKDREIGAMWLQAPGFYAGKLLDEWAAAVIVTNKAKPNMPDLKLYREIGALWMDKPKGEPANQAIPGDDDFPF